MPRCQRSTVRSMCVPSLSVDHAVVNDVVALGRLNPGSFVARRIAVRSLQTIVIGIGVSLHKAKSKARRQRTETTALRTSERLQTRRIW